MDSHIAVDSHLKTRAGMLNYHVGEKVEGMRVEEAWEASTCCDGPQAGTLPPI